MRKISQLLVVFLFLCGVVAAQDVTATIVGTVTDASGAAIPGAAVTVTATDRNVIVRTTVTDAVGNYVATLLPIGNYSVKVEAKGFKTSLKSGIVLHIDDKLTVPIQMEIGETTQQVTVTEDADTVAVELQSSVVAGLVSGTEVRELALNNRNFIQLISLLPGVTSNATSDENYIGTTNPYGSTNTIPFAINGGRTSASNYSVDGADNVDRGSNLTLLSYPNVDTIAEFKVVRGQYSADTGRAGSGQVSVATRSGTSKFHGSAYEYFRNDKLAANDSFSNSRGVARKPLRNNNFGYLLSGPVPGLGTAKRTNNKTFFLWAQEWRLVRSYSTQLGTVPTADLKKGIFSSPVCIDFANNACVSYTTEIKNVNPVAASYIKDLWSKMPDAPTSSYSIVSAMGSSSDYREDMIKIDHTFSSKLSMFMKYSHDAIPTTEPGGLFTNSPLPGVANTKTDSPGTAWLARATWSISPTMLNDVGFNFSRGAILSQPTGLIGKDQSPNINVKLPFAVTLNRVPTLAVSGFSSLTGYGRYDDYNRNYNINDTFTKIMTRWTLRAGFSFNYYQKVENAAGNNVGSFTIPNTPQVGSRPANVTTYQQAWANFLLGYVSSFSQASLDLTPDMRQKQLEWFVQNDYRVKDNLTVNLGVRVSNFWQPWDNNGMLTNFDPGRWDPAKAPQIVASTGNLVSGTGDPLNGILVNGSGSPYGKKVSNESIWKFAPRVGFAWDPFKRKRTAVRGGYGISYDSTLVGIYEQNIFNNPPYVNSVTITNTKLDNPAGGTESVSTAPKYIRGTPQPAMIPYTQTWSFDIQQQVGKATTVMVGYSGSKGTHLLGIVDINEVYPGAAVAAGITDANTPLTSSTTPRVNAIRPYRGYQAMGIIENWFNSNYNALQTSAQRQFGTSSSVRVSYTWSKVLTDATSDRSNAPQNTYNRAADYARATFDRTQVLNISYSYMLPFGNKLSGIPKKLIGGWQMTGIMGFATGVPMRVTSGLGYDWGGLGVLGSSPVSPRPDMVGDPNKAAPHTFAKWFDTSAFAAVPAGVVRPGNAPATAVGGPGYQKYDMSLVKNFKIYDRVSTQIKAEAFNLPNHVNPAGVGLSLGSTTYGQVTSTREPRRIQLAMKLSF